MMITSLGPIVTVIIKNFKHYTTERIKNNIIFSRCFKYIGTIQFDIIFRKNVLTNQKDEKTWSLAFLNY